MSSTLSSRGLDIESFPGGFHPPAVSNRYDAVTNPTGVISLAMAENFLIHDELAEYINNSNLTKVHPNAFSYRHNTAGGPLFLSAMSHFLNQHFSPLYPVEPSQLVGMAGVTALSETVAFALANPGDGIMMCRPIYGRFEVDFGVKAGVKAVYASMKGRDPLGVEAVEMYERCLEEATKKNVVVRALLISNPHNPLGRCYTPESLETLFALCGKLKIHLISDEIYALSVYDSGEPGAVPFTSVLSLDKKGHIDEKYVHVLYGLSKDFGGAGIRLGVLQTSNEELRQACCQMARFHGVSGLSTTTATAILSDSAFTFTLLSTSRRRLAENFHITVAALNKMGVKYHRGANAGLFLLIDLSPFFSPSASLTPFEKERQLSDKFLEAGVFLDPGEEKAEEPGWFRVVFSQPVGDLEAGLRRMERVLRGLEWEGRKIRQ